MSDIFTRALLQNSDIQHYENMEQQMYMQTHQLCQLGELQSQQARQELTHEVGSALGGLTKTLMETFL